MKKQITITILTALWLILAFDKPVILRAELEPVTSKPEIVRDAITKPMETNEINLWAEFTDYLKEMVEGSKHDGGGDPGRIESTDTEGDIQGYDGEICSSDSVPTEGDPAGVQGAEPIIEDPEPEPEPETYVEPEPEPDPEPTMTYVGDWTVTFYCQCEQCCGKWAWSNSTASGATPCAGWTVAAGPSYPFGTILYIEGFGTYEVQDRGVGDGWVDIYVNDHSEIPGYGMTTASVYIMN